MTDWGAQTWAVKLQEAAPGAPMMVVRTLSHVMASCAGPDTLLIIADALGEAVRESRLMELPAACIEWPGQLADVMRDEAPRRA